MVEIVLGTRGVVMTGCEDGHGVDIAIQAGFREGLEGGSGCGFDGGVHPVGGKNLGQGAAGLHHRVYDVE